MRTRFAAPDGSFEVRTSPAPWDELPLLDPAARRLWSTSPVERPRGARLTHGRPGTGVDELIRDILSRIPFVAAVGTIALSGSPGAEHLFVELALDRAAGTVAARQAARHLLGIQGVQSVYVGRLGGVPERATEPGRIELVPGVPVGPPAIVWRTGDERRPPLLLVSPTAGRGARWSEIEAEGRLLRRQVEKGGGAHEIGMIAALQGGIAPPERAVRESETLTQLVADARSSLPECVISLARRGVVIEISPGADGVLTAGTVARVLQRHVAKGHLIVVRCVS